MIHQVRASSVDVARLRELIELQLELLSLVAAEPTIDRTNLEDHIAGTYGRNASQVAAWVYRHSSLINKLIDFAAHPNADEKTALVDKIRADVNLLFAPTPQRLQAVFKCKSGPDPSWKCAAGDFCRQFYTIWSQKGERGIYGFPAYLFVSTSLPKDSYSRWDFVENFLAANNALYLCVICDCTAFRTQADDKAFTSIEHFFPKSIYPHLAIHPYNLIPICSNCNSIKSDDDFMQLCGTLGIQELLLPYQQNQPGLSQMAYIQVSPSQTTGTEHSLEIKIKPSFVFPNSSPLIAHFDALYRVEKRWNNELDQIDEQVFRRMQQFFLVDVQMGNDLSDIEFVIRRVELLMALTSKANLGKDPFGMAMIWMLNYHLDEMRREKEQALIYRNLVCWAQTHCETWESLRKHAEELYARTGKAPDSAENGAP
jgi:hypothetical protein